MGAIPTISTVIPAHNAARFIGEAVHSVLAQTRPAHEIIVVDDGSRDMDYGRLCELHPSIKVLRQSKAGVLRARNLGCEQASGDCVAFLDADDAWLPGKLEEQATYLNAHPEIGAVFTRGLLWRASGDSWTWPQTHDTAFHAATSIATYKDFILGIPASPSSLVIRQDVLRAVRTFDETLSRGEDFDFYFRLSFRHATAVLHSRQVLYRRHEGNTTNTYCGYNTHAEVIKRSVHAMGRIDAFGNSFSKSELRRRLAKIHFQYGSTNFWTGHSLNAMKECALSAAFGGGLKAIAYCMASAMPGARHILRGMKRHARIRSQAEVPADETLTEVPAERMDQPL